MAQRLDESEPVPERLARFQLSEWGGDPSAATAAWGQACRQWLAGHPDKVLPHSADSLEVRQEVIRVRQELERAGVWDDHGPWRD